MGALLAEVLVPAVVEVAAVDDGVGADGPVAVGEVSRDLESPVGASFDALI